MAAEVKPNTVYLGEVIDRPRWLVAFEKWRNSFKATRLILELWAELVCIFLQSWYMAMTTDPEKDRVFPIFLFGYESLRSALMWR
jgi:hypothetical protein